MKVTLIRFALVAPLGSVNNEPTPPLGLAFLAASLKKAGFGVQGIDATGENIENIKTLPALMGEVDILKTLQQPNIILRSAKQLFQV